MPGAGGGVLYVAGEGHVTAQPREAQSLRVGLPVRTGPPAAPTPQLPSSPPFRSWPLKVWSPEQQNWHHQGAYWRRRTLAPPRPPEPESAFQPGPQEACSRPIKVSEPALDPRPDITSSGTFSHAPALKISPTISFSQSSFVAFARMSFSRSQTPSSPGESSKGDGQLLPIQVRTPARHFISPYPPTPWRFQHLIKFLNLVAAKCFPSLFFEYVPRGHRQHLPLFCILSSFSCSRGPHEVGAQ